MGEPTCETCKWWRRQSSDYEGECKIRAPRIVDALIAERTAGNYYVESLFKDIYMSTFFPMTSSEDWCGEHTPKDQENANG